MGTSELIQIFRDAVITGLKVSGPILILTMTLVMIVVMIESVGMFLALSDMTDRPVSPDDLWRPAFDPRGLFARGPPATV